MTHFGYLEFALVAYTIWRHDRRRMRFLITSAAFRNPIIGGLLLSQALTLYTTPVIYLWFDRLAKRLGRSNKRVSEKNGQMVLPLEQA